MQVGLGRGEFLRVSAEGGAVFSTARIDAVHGPSNVHLGARTGMLSGHDTDSGALLGQAGGDRGTDSVTGKAGARPRERSFI
jgi:hypothetical protein